MSPAEPAAADWRADRITAARQGLNPTVLRRLSTSFAVIGDVQFLPGYCVLLIDRLGIERVRTCLAPTGPRFWPISTGSPKPWRTSAAPATRTSGG